MGSFSAAHWLVVLVVVAVLFGRGRIASMMGELGQGIKDFRKGMANDTPAEAPVAVQAPVAEQRAETH